MGKPDTNVSSYGVNVLLSHIDTLEKLTNRLDSPSEIERIHQLRVTTRRIHSVLGIFHDYFPLRELELWESALLALRKSLGEIRDLDVRIELIRSVSSGTVDKKFIPGLNRIILRMEQSRQKQQSTYQSTMEKLARKHVIQHIRRFCNDVIHKYQNPGVYPSELYLLSDMKLTGCFSFIGELEPFITDPMNIKEIHSLRIALKRLRYAVEIFSPLYPDRLEISHKMLRKAQEMTGEIHDCDAWIQFIPNFIEREKNRIMKFYGTGRYYSRLGPGISYFFSERIHQRDKIYQDFISDWDKWKKENIMADMLDEVHRYAVNNDYRYLSG